MTAEASALQYERRVAAFEAARDFAAVCEDPTLLDGLNAADYLDLPTGLLHRLADTALPLAREAAASALEREDERECFHALCRVAVRAQIALASRSMLQTALLNSCRAGA